MPLDPLERRPTVSKYQAAMKTLSFGPRKSRVSFHFYKPTHRTYSELDALNDTIVHLRECPSNVKLSIEEPPAASTKTTTSSTTDREEWDNFGTGEEGMDIKESSASSSGSIGKVIKIKQEIKILHKKYNNM